MAKVFSEFLHTRVQSPAVNRERILRFLKVPRGSIQEGARGWEVTSGDALPYRGRKYVDDVSVTNDLEWTNFSPVCVDIEVDPRPKAFPGLAVVTVIYEIFKPYNDNTSSAPTFDNLGLGSPPVATYEVEGSRTILESEPNQAVRIFASTDGTTSIPVEGDFFVNPGGSVDTAPHGKACIKIKKKPDALPGVWLITCTYQGPRSAGTTGDNWNQYEVRRRRSNATGVMKTTQRVLEIPAATTLPIIGAGLPEDTTQKLNDIDESRIRKRDGVFYNQTTLIYSTQTDREWMRSNINSALLYKVPAITSFRRWIAEDGIRTFGKSPAFPRSYYKVVEGENVSFRPKQSLIFRAIIDDKSWLDPFDNFLGYINSQNHDKMGNKGTLLYLGTKVNPIRGADQPLWEISSHFMKHELDWNKQCKAKIFEVQKVTVPRDPNESYNYVDHLGNIVATIVPSYAGWVEKEHPTVPFGERDAPGEVSLFKTTSFGAFNERISG